MRTGTKLIGVLGVLGAATLGGAMAWPIGAETASIALQGDVQKGAYLARVSGCISCHSDFENGGAPLAGGAGLSTEFGTFYPPNLTTDGTHGIGDWTVEEFAKAIRQGISPEGDPYYPAFSYPFYADMTDQDIADLWAAFQTVSPVNKPAPDHDVSFPFDQRWGLKLWRAAFLYDPDTEPEPTKSEEWNRSKALVQGPAHCAACHTPRNLAGGRILGETFSGNDALPGGSKAPSITSESLAESDWTISNMVYALQTGITPSGDAFGGSMTEVVQGNTQFMSTDDLKAMATYLLDSGV